jgi:hypothetical protein
MRFQKRSAADRDDVTKAAALLTASAACRDRGHALIGFLSAKPRPGAGPGGCTHPRRCAVTPGPDQKRIAAIPEMSRRRDGGVLNQYLR